MEKFDERGREIPDQTPVEVPANAKRPPSMEDMIARYVRAEVSQVAADRGFGTWEEEDDFEDPTEDVVEHGSDHYITDVVMNPLEASQESVEGEVDLIDSGRGSTGENSTSGPTTRQEGPEAPQEKQEQ